MTWYRFHLLHGISSGDTQESLASSDIQIKNKSVSSYDFYIYGFFHLNSLKNMKYAARLMGFITLV